jgi:hypothetical protein
MAFFKSESFCALSLPTGSRKSPGVSSTMRAVARSSSSALRQSGSYRLFDLQAKVAGG